MGKNIILTDNSIEDTEEFKNGLEESTQTKWEIIVKNSNRIRKNGLYNIVRYVKYFSFPFKILIKRKQFDKIIAWQQFYGIILAFYCNLFKVKKTFNLTIMTFIYKEKKNYLRNVYFKFIKFSIDNEYVDKIVVFSENETEYYSKLFNIKKGKFVFTKLGIKTISVNSINNNESYIISAGRSNRDYEFLINSLKNEKFKLKIVTDIKLSSNSSNIEIVNNVMGNEFYKMLKNAYCVIIPLKDVNISSGQLVILQAMQLKVPIVVTNSNSVKNYIIDDYNGILINNNKDELIAAIKKLSNKEKREYLISNAYNEYLKNYSLMSLGKKIGNFVK